MNIATKMLEESGETLEDFAGICLELADDVLHYAGRGAIVHIEPRNPEGTLRGLGPGDWGWHAAALIDGLVHDPWLGPAAPLEEYPGRAFPGEKVVVEIFGDEKEKHRA